ncbi:hypothetical protein [Streptomyces noursei]|uniref:BioF2-like acetyltransferase domain-containing protein n=1 Tax=Streptomyces noursei TaxID=1971 RepID=A0A2N8P7L5_STRNR|nr:hypothetical protein [Streptomyces noursei]PNE37006.1 hypothetical protein AOB60_21480 [Streptomyces noursei]
MDSDTVSPDELAKVVAGLPVQVWNSPTAAELYGHTLNLVCRTRAGRTAGVWVVPLDDGGTAARRPFRLLPYAAPWSDPGLHPVDRHRAVHSMTQALMARVDSAELPMDPRFGEVAALSEAGAELLCRHTRILELREGRDPRTAYVATARNHIRAAARRHTVHNAPLDSFDFSRAVVGQPAPAVAARRRSGLRIGREEPALCLAATDPDGVCRGQVFVLLCDGAAVLMHSWFDRTGARGVPSLLVDEAITWAQRQPGTEVFDFEGSVLPSIDRFMTGFGAHARGYPQLRWIRSGRPGSDAGEFG